MPIPVAVAEPGDLGVVRGRRSNDVEARILDATMVRLARHGVAKTTVDDIAREADCSRATV